MEEVTRQITLDDKELYKMVEEKGKLVKEGRGISKEIEELIKQHGVLVKKHDAQLTKVNALKMKIIKRSKKLADKFLDEYEVPVTTDIKDGKIVFTCADTLAEFKKSFKKHDKWTQVKTK